MFVFPLWAITVLTIDFLVLFGLVTQSDESWPDALPETHPRRPDVAKLITALVESRSHPAAPRIIE
jgi:hypothetical protein